MVVSGRENRFFMSVLSVCKNVIAWNNKRGWLDSRPPIRVAKTLMGKPVDHVYEIGIVDSKGDVVARLISTQDGKPIVKCGAKVAVVTEYDVIAL